MSEPLRDQTSAIRIQAEDGIRDTSVTGVQTCALLFQAEDGIRDTSVTGVQTCALPIQAEDGTRDTSVTGVQTCALPIYVPGNRFGEYFSFNLEQLRPVNCNRSEERREGKSVDLGGRRIINKTTANR